MKLYVVVVRTTRTMQQIFTDAELARWWVKDGRGETYEVFEIDARPWSMPAPASSGSDS